MRIGIDAGEPVSDSNDLFGATVQMAARLCQMAEPDAIVVSAAIRGLLPEPSRLTGLGRRSLKGFAQPVDAYEVAWR